MSGRSLRAGDALLPLIVAVVLAIGAPFSHAQGLFSAAESATNGASTSRGADDAGKDGIDLHAYFRSGHVDLHWETGLSGVAQYKVQRAAHGSHDWTDLKTVPGSELNYTDTDAKTIDYDYRVTALDYDGAPLATSAVRQASRVNMLNVLSGDQITVQDILDVSVWRETVKTFVVRILDFIPHLFSALILFGIFWLIYRLLRRIVLGSMAKAHVDSSIRDMLGALLRWSIMGFALVIACDQIGIQIAALLTGVSIIGLAIGFAAQETLANFIAGVVIFWDKPFKVGDWIDIDNTFGKVLRVSFRSTRLLALNGETIVFPNTQMLANRVANHSTHPMTRVDVPISIAYKESIDQARAILLGTVVGDERICKEPPPSVVVSQCADSSVNLMLWLWIRDESVEKSVYYEYLERAKKALDAASIEIPFPHMQLMLENTPALAMLRGDSLQTSSPDDE
jgi:small conductance mechanosensitive channel